MFDLDDENRLISSSMKVEDNDTEVSLRPKNLSDYLGQEKVKEQLEIFIEAAKSRNEPLDHVLLYGCKSKNYIWTCYRKSGRFSSSFD